MVRTSWSLVLKSVDALQSCFEKLLCRMCFLTWLDNKEKQSINNDTCVICNERWQKKTYFYWTYIWPTDIPDIPTNAEWLWAFCFVPSHHLRKLISRKAKWTKTPALPVAPPCSQVGEELGASQAQRTTLEGRQVVDPLLLHLLNLQSLPSACLPAKRMNEVHDLHTAYVSQT